MSDIQLKVRPRWKRIAHIPHLVRLYVRAGCGLFLSLKLTWIAVTYPGLWSNEKP